MTGPDATRKKEPGRRIQLLICDDHEVVRQGLRSMLSSRPEFEVVGEARDAEQVIALATRLRPDVVLMDLGLGLGPDGATAIGRIREQNPETKFLVLTALHPGAQVLRSLEQGAGGYLQKDAPREEIFEAIRNVAVGKPHLARGAEDLLLGRLRGDAAAETLSLRETQILRMVARSKTNAEIARELWVSEPTAKRHLTRIYRKLGAEDRAGAVAVALESGLLDLDP